jgi:uncharacterized caspase-like protein
MPRTKRLIVVLFIALISASAQVIAQESWQPSRTWVIAVGVLEWQDSDSFNSFPKEGRKDAELVDFFKQAGVPRDQILFLKDKEATKDHILRAMTRLLARAHEGDMLIFYFTGHGAQDDAGATYFANYDADGDDLAHTALSVKSIFNLIERNFSGSRVLLTADCCYSGALAVEAARRRTSLAYAVLASARSDSLSTANWTFTEALIGGFRGNARADQNQDGEIELAELAHYARARMLSKEDQRTSFTTTAGFSPETIMADVQTRTTTASQSRQSNERVEVEWQGNWYRAVILETRGAKYKIHYLGYGAEWDEWIDAARLRRASTTSVSGRNVYQNFSAPNSLTYFGN